MQQAYPLLLRVLDPRRSRAPGTALLAVGVIALASPAISALDSSSYATQEDPALVGQLLTPQDAPTLTTGDQARAREIVTGDARIKALLKGVSYSITNVAVWTRGAPRQHDLLGAAVQLHLDSPTTLRGAWPTMVYDQSEQTTPPYHASQKEQAFKSVSDVYALVDLDHGHVVHLQPGPGSAPLIPPPTPPVGTSVGN
jgi:hypothetical protein